MIGMQHDANIAVLSDWRYLIVRTIPHWQTKPATSENTLEESIIDFFLCPVISGQVDHYKNPYAACPLKALQKNSVLSV